MNFFELSVLLTSAASLSLAIFVYLKGRDKTLNRSLALFSLALAAWLFAQGVGAMAVQPELILTWTRLQVGAAVCLPVLYLHFIFSLLGTDREKRLVIWASYFLTAIFILLDFTPLFVHDLVLVKGLRYFPKLTFVYAAFALWLSASFSYGLGQLIFVLRQSSGEQYKKLLYVFVAVVIGFLGGGTSFFPIFNLNLPVVSHFALPLYVAVAVYAIVRHKLIDITVYVRKGLIYSLITALLTSAYLLLLLLVRNLSQRWVQDDSIFVTILTLFGIGFIFQPLREWSQAIIDHLFFKSRYDYQATIRIFSEKLSSVVRLEELNQLVGDGLLKMLKIKEAAVYFGDRQPAGEPALIMPVKSKGKKWGSLVLGPKLSGDGYSAADINLLAILANQAAIAFENIQLYQQLVRSESLAALGTLAAGLAHEIKNPLAAIKAMTQIMPENIADQEFIRKYTEMIPRQLDRINDTIENLLRTGQAPKLERKNVDANVILSEVLDLHGNFCQQQGIELACNLDDLPPISADADQLRQVFVNLVLNACQAMPEGGTIEVSSLVQTIGNNQGWGRQIIIQISDTGIGIPSDKLDKIFNPFFTLKEKGSGLGLFTAFRIIQEHGGIIEVKSLAGEGTSFTIRLPVAEEGSNVSPIKSEITLSF